MGGGGSLTASRKQPGHRFFFLFFFLFSFLSVLNLFYILQRGSNGFITENTILFNGSRGSNFQVLISIETHITCDFSGGGEGGGVRTPYHPLLIRTWSHRRITPPHYMCKLPGRVKSGKFGHYLQIVLFQIRRLIMSRHIRSFTFCLGN